MPKIIVTSRYMKNNPKKNAASLVHYMGTREGVELTQEGAGTQRVPTSTLRMIFKLCEKYPEIFDYPELKTFGESLTMATADELIDAFAERNGERWGDMKALINYMAKRPGVEELGSHGLFSQTDDKIDLDKAADEVGQHQGTIWTHVISLRREDAEHLGYDKAAAWRDLVRGNSPELAQAMGISPSNMQWYAAFHNTGHHPHIHLLVYAKDGKQGWLTKHGIEQLRSTFGNDIFRNEQYMLFQMETQKRDQLKEKARELLEEEHRWEPQLQMKLLELSSRLAEHKGKKSYGYLKKRDKELVDEIVRLLAADPMVAAVYQEWDRVNREKLSLYYEKKGERIPLEENKVFHSLKNSVIRAAGLLLLEQGSHRKIQGIQAARMLLRIAESFCSLAQSHAREHRQQLEGQIDSKLWEMIEEKKRALGQKHETLRRYDDDDEMTMSM